MDATDPSRRPLKTRSTRWAAAVARGCIKVGLRPNAISLLSIVFAAGGAACLVACGISTGSTRMAYLICAAAGIQLRLLCNMLDGMVAVEGGLGSKSGEIYNELPDRFADALILVGAGYAMPIPPWAPLLGWTAAILAVITAYVRALGASAGAGQHFLGPMAKPHRMATLTAGCILEAGANLFGSDVPLVRIALAVIILGCLVTIWRRCGRIVRALEAK